MSAQGTDDSVENAAENAADFALNAEARRQNGDALAAVEIAKAGLAEKPGDLRGRIALALARIDLGDVLQAREELAVALSGAASESLVPFDQPLAPPPATPVATFATPLSEPAPVEAASLGLDRAVGEDELESAFAAAESNPDDMMDANRLVEQTLRAADLDTPEAGFDVASHPTYATESMAMLLDEQGRADEAEAVRESLASSRAGVGDPAASAEIDAAQGPAWGDAGLGPDHAERVRVVTTLEGWLHNLKRNSARDAQRGRDTAGGAA